MTVASGGTWRWSAPPAPRSAPFGTHPCPCRAEHAPPVPFTHGHHLWPLFAGGPDTPGNVRHVCPATHDWSHVIWRAFAAAAGPVPRRPGWPHYAHAITLEGWQAMERG